MIRYEYKVLTPPAKGVKAPGRKSAEARYAHAVELFLNAQAAEGWEYLRSDLLPGSERQGLTSSQTVYRTVLVFRRPMGDAAETVISEAQAVAEAVADAEEVDAKVASPVDREPEPPVEPETPEPDSPESDPEPEPDPKKPGKPD
ncbi:DUF4177 domain-containing protein [Roseovarius pelagicus]|uniref:DUF4177 domain-containing protein n=1 Tax=Roseovarius pelagicus TaxID=2980108 RepID=A0ABY6DD05_9RHOB|nr:DUF4177 domain-containing protein [Roseovarius pelagicus]UXX84027.1 DUF4177 domain-containing protein [Roseovarius pelagicus]